MTTRKQQETAMTGQAAEGYFASRSLAFWCAFGFLLTMPLCLAPWAFFFPRSFWEYMLFGEARPYADLLIYIKIRAAISMFLSLILLVAFVRRSWFARYAVYGATVFVCVNFFADMQHIAGNFTSLASLSSATFLLIRPLIMLALMVLSFSFHDLAHLERPPFWRKSG